MDIIANLVFGESNVVRYILLIFILLMVILYCFIFHYYYQSSSLGLIDSPPMLAQPVLRSPELNMSRANTVTFNTANCQLLINGAAVQNFTSTSRNCHLLHYLFSRPGEDILFAEIETNVLKDQCGVRVKKAISNLGLDPELAGLISYPGRTTLRLNTTI